MTPTSQLTEDQLAKQQKRREKREVLSERSSESFVRLLPRNWLNVPSDQSPDNSFKVKILSWNILAQSLVRRELFPTSDCLKAAQRDPLLHHELTLRPDVNVVCLQEVDRIERLGPVLERIGLAYTFVKGRDKKHGCLIGFKREQLSLIEQETVYFDDQTVQSDGRDTHRKGLTIETRNIALVVALKDQASSRGLIIATTHLFWHPAYTYERTRQAAILLREVSRFCARMRTALPDSQCIIAGDFNCEPSDPAYSLLVGLSITKEQSDLLMKSRVVHSSIDHTVPSTSSTPDAEGSDPDRVITNARPAVDSDGLLTDSELEAIARGSGCLSSVYDEGLRRLGSVAGLKTFRDRRKLSTELGACEPEYTSFTHYWKSTLDYIFVMVDKSRPHRIQGLLQPLTSSEMEPGLPKKSTCGSDHIPLCAELCWDKECHS